MAVAAIVLLVVALIATDRFVGRPNTAAPTVFRNRLVATPADSGSSTWFCAGGVATTAQAIADLRVILANPSTEPATGTVTFVGERGQRSSIPIVVPAQGRAELASKNVLPVSDVAAIVEVNVGGVAVDHRLTRGSQSVVAPCTPTASDTWHFPLGVTTRDATTTVSLFNPFAEDAILDFRFASDRGGVRPTALQGFVVPAGSVRTVDVGSYVRRRNAVATTISTRVGRVVAEQIIRYDGSGGPRGVTLVPGSPGVGRAWYFPAGRSTSVLKERYVLYNPTAADVQTHVDVVVDGGDVEPFVFDVPAHDEVLLDLGDEARVPKNVDYSVVVSTTSGGIVAGRLVDARSRFRRGLAGTLGSRIASDEWIVADAAASVLIDDHLIVLNPTDTPAPLTLRTLSDAGTTRVRFLGGPTRDELVVPAGGRVDVRLGDVVSLDAGSVVVATDGTPVVVERVRVAVAEAGPLVARTDGGSAPTSVATTTGAPTSTAPATTAPTSTAAPTSAPIPAAAATAAPATTLPATPGASTAVASTVAGGVATPIPPASDEVPTAAPSTPSTPSTASPTSAAPAVGAAGGRFATGIAVAVAPTSTLLALPATTVPVSAAPTTAAPTTAPTTTARPATTAPIVTTAPAITTATPPGATTTVPTASAPPTAAPGTTVPAAGAPSSTPTGAPGNPAVTSSSPATSSTSTSSTSTSTTTSTTTTTTTAVPGTRIAVGRVVRAALGTSASIAIPLR